MRISELLERAKERLDVSSDRELARALSLDNKMIGHYRNGTRLPSDEQMMAICLASGADPVEHLLSLNIVRAGGRASTIYRRLLKQYASEKAGAHDAETA